MATQKQADFDNYKAESEATVAALELQRQQD